MFGSGLAALCHFTVLQRAGATNAMLVTLIMPLTPIVLGRRYSSASSSTGREIVGALIIAAALLIIDGRILRLGRRGP